MYAHTYVNISTYSNYTIIDYTHKLKSANYNLTTTITIIEQLIDLNQLLYLFTENPLWESPIINTARLVAIGNEFYILHLGVWTE